jgi:outer membrane protein OmpA-like peptidoglycan-associated protein
MVALSCLTLEKHLLKKRNLSTLGSITEILKEYPYSKFLLKVILIATVTKNQTLSENRAAALKSHLIENG